MTQITPKVYPIEGVKHPDPRAKVFPYLFIEDKDDLTLIDPSFLSQLPILENYVQDVGYNIKNVKRIILTHVHMDHSQAANEEMKESAKDNSVEGPYSCPYCDSRFATDDRYRGHVKSHKG